MGAEVKREIEGEVLATVEGIAGDVLQGPCPGADNRDPVDVVGERLGKPHHDFARGIAQANKAGSHNHVIGGADRVIHAAANHLDPRGDRGGVDRLPFGEPEGEVLGSDVPHVVLHQQRAAVGKNGDQIRPEGHQPPIFELLHLELLAGKLPRVLAHGIPIPAAVLDLGEGLLRLPSGHEPTLNVAKLNDLNLAAAQIRPAPSPTPLSHPNLQIKRQRSTGKSSILRSKKGRMDKDFRKLC